MSIWHHDITPETYIETSRNTLNLHLDMRLEEVGDDFLKMSMPVDHRTHQPMGILHGGASVALAETIGSIAASMAAKPGTYCVGLDINANHIRSVREGRVYATARPIHIGGSTQVWEIEICDENARKVCVSRLTMAVLQASSG